MNKKILSTVFLSIFLSSASLFAAEVSKDQDSDTYRLLALFGDVFEKVRKDYVEEVTDQKLVESALNGMLSSLDPHSGYLNDESFKDMQVQTKGEFGGLGIEVTMDSGWVKVVSPIDDTPAHKAGIKPGDYITHIDGTAVMGLSLNEAVDKMRGKPGTDIKLTIRRKSVPEALDITLTRAIIKIKPVRYEVKEEDKIGYIRINTFSEKTTESVKKAVKEITKELGDKPIGYIIDLRNNPGGLLDQAVAVSDLFLESGEIVSTRSRNPEDTMRFNAKPGDIAEGLPIVILINDGSASASEIVAGALQDHKRAVIAGMKSFGKGSVQTIIPIVNHGAIRITTARYYTPSGVSIQAKGIEPDIEIKPAKIEEIAYNDIRSESELPKALSNDSQPKSKPSKSKKAKDEFTKFDEPKPQDYQLDRAIDILKGISVYQKASNK